MRFVPVVVLGQQWGGAIQWVRWFSHRTGAPAQRFLVVDPDWSLRCDALVGDDVGLSVRAPLPAVYRKRIVYPAMLRRAAAVVYVASAIRDLSAQNDEDFAIFDEAWREVGSAAPVLTLLNDLHDGRWEGGPQVPFTPEEAARWMVPASRLLRTSIGEHPGFASSASGGEQSLAALLALMSRGQGTAR